MNSEITVQKEFSYHKITPKYLYCFMDDNNYKLYVFVSTRPDLGIYILGHWLDMVYLPPGGIL